MSSHTPAQRSAPAPPALTRSPVAPPASPGAFVPPFLSGRTTAAPTGVAHTQPETVAAETTLEPPLPWEVTGATRSAPPLPAFTDEGIAAPAWESELQPPQPVFPLDAFIIPDHAQRLPSGYQAENDLGQRVADQLDLMARVIRTRGIAALGAEPYSDELARIITAAVASYVQRST